MDMRDKNPWTTRRRLTAQRSHRPYMGNICPAHNVANPGNVVLLPANAHVAVAHQCEQNLEWAQASRELNLGGNHDARAHLWRPPN
jgi:hypothetical protein